MFHLDRIANSLVEKSSLQMLSPNLLPKNMRKTVNGSRSLVLAVLARLKLPSRLLFRFVKDIQIAQYSGSQLSILKVSKLVSSKLARNSKYLISTKIKPTLNQLYRDI